MKRFFLLLFFKCYSILLWSQVPSCIWLNGATVNSGYCYSTDMITDSYGNIYVTGAFGNSSVTFGATTLTSFGKRDMFLIKYDTFGNLIWAINAGGANDEVGYALAIDSYNNIYVIGNFLSPKIAFGSYTLTNSGEAEIFMAKFHPNGSALWAKSIIGNSDEYGAGIYIDNNNNICITGGFRGNKIQLDTITLTNTNIPNFDHERTYDSFVAKYDTSGYVMWAKKIYSLEDDFTSRIAGDSNDNLYVTGRFEADSVMFETTMVKRSGSSDFFLAKYDPKGNIEWIRNTGDVHILDPNSIAITKSNDIYITSAFTSASIVFGNKIVHNTDSFGNTSRFLVKYDTLGIAIWAKAVGGYSHEYSNNIFCDQDHNIYVTGAYYSDSISDGKNVLYNSGMRDILISKYDSSGSIAWIKSAKSKGIDNANTGVAVGNDIFISGVCGPPSFTVDALSLHNNSTNNFFLMKLGKVMGIYDNHTTEPIAQIFPNPSNGAFLVSSEYNIEEIRITNLLGQTINSTWPNSSKFSFELTDSGIYFVTMRTDKKAISTQKIIVQQ